ncbi:hypothetical protein [Streptomyces sp. 8N616]|uniref:hypothetical protein n=1 Tax=Streptomyces sp. 8N616 TaxID=3457414 RepID=UPI003FD589A2
MINRFNTSSAAPNSPAIRAASSRSRSTRAGGVLPFLKPLQQTCHRDPPRQTRPEEVPRLTAALVHADPAPVPGVAKPHAELAHHAA